MNIPNQEETKYTQVVDEKSGEIKYVPDTPPEPPESSDSKQSGDDKLSEEPDENGMSTDMQMADEVEDKLGEGSDADLSEDDKLTDIFKRLDDNNKRLRYAKRLQSGKLDGRRLTSYKTSDRLFKKKDIKHKNYQFTFMIDTSGSMFDYDKIVTATESVAKAMQSLQQLGIKSAAIGMNMGLLLLKDYSEEYNEQDYVFRMKRSLSSKHEGSYWASGTSEAVAYRETLKYMAANKPAVKTEQIVFVLSDGEPGGGFNKTPICLNTEGTIEFVPGGTEGNNNEDLRSFWLKQPDIKVFGLGIQSTASQIPRSKQINDIKELPLVMGNLIQEILL